MFIPQWRKIVSVSILIMMLAFLPLHIWDVFRGNPAIGSHKASLLRLPFQFVLIAGAWFISKV